MQNWIFDHFHSIIQLLHVVSLPALFGIHTLLLLFSSCTFSFILRTSPQHVVHLRGGIRVTGEFPVPTMAWQMVQDQSAFCKSTSASVPRQWSSSCLPVVGTPDGLRTTYATITVFTIYVAQPPCNRTFTPKTVQNTSIH